MPGAPGVFRLLTPPGEGGIAVYAVEGPGARAALSATMRPARMAELRPGGLAHGRLTAADGTTLDEVIVACLPAIPAHRQCPPTERFELNCHAGGAAAAAVAERLTELGLTPGEPAGEPGLTPPERDFRAALGLCRTRRQLEALAAARAALPAALDAARKALARPAERARAAEALGAVVEESRRLARLLATHRAVLAGPANAGKSTLFNRLAGSDLAIASPHPGTTRDFVEAALAVRGLAVDLADTAGLGPAPADGLARSAQLQGLRLAAGAELLLLVVDAANPPAPDEAAQLAGLAAGVPGTLVVLNKCDLAPAGEAAPPGAPDALSALSAVRFSALTGRGLDGLTAAVERALLPEPPRGGAAAPPGGRSAELIAEAYTCARRSAMNNDPAAAAEAAARLGAVLGASA